MDRLNFCDEQLHNLERVALSMELSDDVGLLYKYRVNKRHNFVLEQLPFLA
ncbi:MAG: hypothetical protein ACK521_01710 [bacterium]